MPRQTKTHLPNPQRKTARSRLLGVVLISTALIATTSCTPEDEPEPVSNPVKLLQSVHVGLSPAAGVQTIEGTTISVAADGASSAEDTEYTAEEVVGELPVRVGLQYRAGEKSGSDLDELQGHTGPVEINLTVENLTVKPQVIEYDAAGQTRSETALVGAPLTIAASTKLDGVRVDDITPGSADGTLGTNGVLSRADDGAAVVQWATVLAPPRSGASTTLRLVADVKDFQVPAIDVAVQPGISTNMSAEGVLAGAFSSGAGSEMELQTRTISLVSDVNTVLIKAGATITEVRKNLETTSQTLGVKTAGELRDNSEALAGTMSGLKSQLTSLGADLETATKGTESVTMAQLQQTVAAVDSMLGDTSATPPPAEISEDGCAAVVTKPEQAGTVYGSILTMASQLDAYATVSADCRELVVADMRTAIGPEKPTAEVCAAEAESGEEGAVSITCSLYNSNDTISKELIGLVESGNDLVEELNPDLVTGAIEKHGASAAKLAEVSEKLAALRDRAKPAEDYNAALQGVTNAIDAAKASVEASREASAAAKESIEGLRAQLTTIRTTARGANGELINGLPLDQSMTDQNAALAEELCELMERNPEEPKLGELSAEEVEKLRSYLTSIPCGGAVEGEELRRPIGFPEPMDTRLTDQSTAWNNVLAQVDTKNADAAINQAFTALDKSFDETNAKLDAVTKAVKALDGAATGRYDDTDAGLITLETELGIAIDSYTGVSTDLKALEKQQRELGDNIKESLEGVQENTAKAVREAVDGQVREVTAVGDKSTDSVTTAFNNSISGLKSTSDQVVGDAGDTVDKQRGELQEESGALAGALAKSTQASLERIASSTSGSTRDVEGADALLSSSLNKVMLDLGDRTVNGSGLLGSMTTSAAKADTADYQLALAAQNAEGYANIRSRDVDGLLLRQAQFKAALTAVDALPAFHLEVPAGASSQTLYTLRIGGGE
ncbi:hypothetical protein MUK71_01980 [Arthrobacter zhangbolii]|uniref:Uncharacterized protein n=1 Tax=Arthrobacter zhangbolii TaxID=2886936 RepID=A0A9X1S9Y4_9MICC|nr:hypothetical protein [Arthrobacter zhangbolii]MCC3273643.1 hypothetical protein [Arthrobacter zhangbolii]UON92448.1 hypothetical protein MUK71_01980 [Arthrobacter zhangbolii]